MDVLDLVDVGSRIARGRVRRVIALAGFLLIVGWSQRWPIAYPLVQGAIDGRVAQLSELVPSDR